MTTVTLTLAEFLLARIAEDEESARYARYDVGDHWWLPEYADPSRVLAECDAKRRMVHLAGFHEIRLGPGLDYALRFLALPYADHPDYRPEWRP